MAKKKSQAWEHIAERVSNVSDVGATGFKGRTAKEVREKYSGLKKTKKRKKQYCRKQTGHGGVLTDPYDPIIEEILGKDSDLTGGVRQSDEGEIFFNYKVVEPSLPSSMPTAASCLDTGNAKCSDADVTLNGVSFGEGSSVYTLPIPDPPPDGGVQQVDISISIDEENGGPITEGMQTLARLASLSPSVSPPVHGSSAKKRRAENKRMGVRKTARQLDYTGNPVILEYIQILIQKEKQALEREKEAMETEKEKQAMEREKQAMEREKEAMEREKQKEKQAMEREKQAMEREKQAMEREAKNDRLAAERDRQAARFYAVSSEVAEFKKQKLEAELKEMRKS